MAAGKIGEIQALRGIAATLVAAFHLYGVERDSEGSLFWFFRHGEAGVDIFFVISGFIIFYTARPDRGLGNFVEARFWRIFPPYWFILLGYIAASLGLWLLLGDDSKLPSGFAVVASFLLLPVPEQIIVIAWTLTIEIAFYLLFAITFFRGGVRALYLGLFAWVALSQVYQHQTAVVWAPFNYLLHSAVLEFLYGVIIATLFVRGERRLQDLSLVLGVLGLAAFLLTDSPLLHGVGREFVPGVPAALIVYGLLGRGWPVPDSVLLWGESSYILYLLHLLVYSLTGKVTEMALGGDPYQSTLIRTLMLVTVVGLSMVLSATLERRYQRWYRPLLRR